MPEELLLEKKVWAVVGANQNPEKYGNMIYKKLKSREYEVYAVNPLYEVVEGDTCYKDLSALPKLPDVVVMVVSPKTVKAVIEESAQIGVKNIWFQPCTHTPGLIEMANELGLETVQACVLVLLR